MSNTQLAEKAPTLRQLLLGPKVKEQFAAALPVHLKPERFIRVAITALTRTPKLQECTPESFMKCLLDLSAYGLEPDGRRAHLIPFSNRSKGTVECTLIIDWKGLAELALRSGMIAKIHADLICENDQFEYNMGEITVHKINFREPRGEPYAAYAMAETKDGAKFVQVMTRQQIETIRNDSQGYKSAMQYGKDSPWTTAPGEMWKKTAFRRLSKWLPLSAEFRDAVEKEDEQETTRDVTPSAATSKLFNPPALEQKAEGAPTGATVEDLEALMQRDDVSMAQLNAVMLQNEAITEMCDEPRELPAKAVTEAVKEWASIIKLVKGGQGE